MKYSLITVLLFLLTVWNSPCRSQEKIKSGLVPSVFQTDSILQITVQTDIMGLLDQMTSEAKYQPAEIIFPANDKIDSLKTKIRVRGHFRKDTANCDFPPLRINFKKSDIMNTFWGPQDKFRIVTHCRTYDTHFMQYILREYLVYKIYKILNPLSLNVRLLKITYVDTGNYFKPFTRYGFLLEDEAEFAARFNMERMKDPVNFQDLNEKNSLLLSLFEFMIGDTDWIVPFAKNLILLKKGETNYAVPFDFDYCGIVNTDYRNEYGYTSLSKPERTFKGGCYTEKEMKEGLKIFRKSRKKIERLIMSSKELDRNSFLYMYNYISQFYDIIGSKNERIKNFNVNCNN